MDFAIYMNTIVIPLSRVQGGCIFKKKGIISKKKGTISKKKGTIVRASATASPRPKFKRQVGYGLKMMENYFFL